MQGGVENYLEKSVLNGSHELKLSLREKTLKVFGVRQRLEQQNILRSRNREERVYTVY